MRNRGIRELINSPSSRFRRASISQFPDFLVSREGFTMVEVVVMLVMLTLIAGMVLASFPRLSQRIHLQRSIQQAALAVRRAQNMSFAVRQADTLSGRVIPPAYGVHFSRLSPNSFIIFADLKDGGGSNDGIYRPDVDAVVETLAVDPGVGISRLISDVGGGNQNQDVINISFSVPEARMSIANAALPVGESAEITFAGTALSGTRSILVRTSGQVRMQ